MAFVTRLAERAENPFLSKGAEALGLLNIGRGENKRYSLHTRGVPVATVAGLYLLSFLPSFIFPFSFLRIFAFHLYVPDSFFLERGVKELPLHCNGRLRLENLSIRICAATKFPD